MHLPLTLKFFLFAACVAVAPLAMVSENLARITRDELKSAANEDLTAVAVQLRSEIDSYYLGRWLAPIFVIRNGIDNPELGVPQKVSLLTLGLEEMPDVVAMQLILEGADLPMMVTDQTYSALLSEAGLDPVQTLAAPPEVLATIAANDNWGRPVVRQLDHSGEWIATLALPLDTPIAGRAVVMAAQIRLTALSRVIARHPFRQRGEISLINATGHTVLEGTPRDLTGRAIVKNAIPLITANARADAQESYIRADGSAVLGAYAFPESFDWAVVTELHEATAYAVVEEMTRRILIVGLVGFAIASIVSLLFARGLTGPILKIGQVAERIGEGDFTARVEKVRSRDEIGDLSARINTMAGQLGERLELMKFVSRGTVDAIQQADAAEGISRGGERRDVAVLFTDIRGYTAFSGSVPPEVVVDLLNSYFEAQAEIVERHGGDIDKFIGDALVGLFEGEDKELRATLCAVEIEEALAKVMAARQDHKLGVGIGIASGEVVLGAMGARARMDFTVLGSTVNLAARLCDKAGPGEVYVDKTISARLQSYECLKFTPLEPIPLKGYADPMPVYLVSRPAGQRPSA